MPQTFLLVENNDRDIPELLSMQRRHPILLYVFQSPTVPAAHQLEHLDYISTVETTSVYIVHLSIAHLLLPSISNIVNIHPTWVIMYKDTFTRVVAPISQPTLPTCMSVQVPTRTDQIEPLIHLFKYQLGSCSTSALVVFSRPNCPMCSIVKPVLQQLSLRGPVFIVNTNEMTNHECRDPFFAQTVGKAVQFVPSMYIYNTSTHDLVEFAFKNQPHLQLELIQALRWT